MIDAETISLGDAVFRFQTVSPQKDASAQQMLQRFVRFFGAERPMGTLKAWEIEDFGLRSGVDSLAKLQAVKSFLKYADEAGMTIRDKDSKSLAGHLKVKRAPARQRAAQSARTAGPTVRLSAEGHQKAADELERLKTERLGIAEDIRRAMADKDFRENAPLDAARDKAAHADARIRELEETLRSAQIIAADDVTGTSKGEVGRCRLGSRVVILDLEAQEQMSYTLVDPKEVNPVAGKISVESPVGKALLNKRRGETVEVRVPAGFLRYRIESVDAKA